MTINDFRSKYKLSGGTTAKAPIKSSGLGGNLADNIAGGIGGTIGQIIGTPADLIAGPAGTMAGGAVGGGLAQGGAEALQELLSGKGFNGGQIASQGAQGAALGAIPLVDEAKTAGTIGEAAADTGLGGAIKNLLAKQQPLTASNLAKRTVLRAGTGAAGGAAAQVASNLGQGKPVDQNVLQNAAETGASNVIIPGVLNKTGNWLRNIKEELNQQTVGGPIEEMQNMFDKTSSAFVGDNTKGYAMSKGIIPSSTDESGKLLPEGLMTKDYVDTALAKRKQVASQVESKLQSLLPTVGEKTITQSQIKPMISDFLKNNYANMSENQANKAFLSDIQSLAGKTAASDSVDIKEVMSLLKEEGNKRLNEPQGSVGTVNALKRIVGRGYNEQNPTAWNGLYNNLKNFVEDNVNPKNRAAVQGLNNEHSQLIKMRGAMNKYAKSGTQYPITQAQALKLMDRARYGKTVGMSAERGMPPASLVAQQLAQLGAGLAGYHLMGGLGGVGAYLMAGQAKTAVGDFTHNPETSTIIAKLIKDGGPTGKALESLLQQKLVHNPIQQNSQ